MGYNCLFPYLCGHGASESNYVTMGWNDRIDIKAWIDYIINENANAKIVLFGLSMGAGRVQSQHEGRLRSADLPVPLRRKKRNDAACGL